jgi:WG containing repeat
MCRNFIVLILTCILSVCAQAQRNPLFQIVEKNRIGFINRTGDVMIKPIFRSVGAFVKGLAPARIDGLYGYIDTLGDFVIPPIYDYAEPFSEDLAVVVRDERQMVIQRDGKHCFSSSFAEMGSFNLGRALVISKSGKKGLIDVHGKLVIDTIFESIFPSESGQYVVELDGKDPGRYQYGIFNRLGKATVPLDTFDYIRPFSEGFAVAKWRPGKDNLAKNLVFDTSGQIVFEHIISDDSGIIKGPFHEGRASLRFWPGMSSGYSNFSEEYEGYIDTKGKIMLKDTSVDSANDFQNGLAFIRLKNSGYQVIDTYMGQVGTFLFKTEGEFGSNARFAVAKPEGQEKYAVITRNGTIKISSPINQSEEEYFAGQHIVFGVEQKRKPGEEWPKTRYGVYDTTGKVIIEARCSRIADEGFQYGVLATIMEGRLTYFNEKGEVIWQQSEVKVPEDINIDHMNRGYFYAGSKVDELDLGGFGKSDNQPQKFNPGMVFPRKSLCVWVDTSNLVQTPGMYNTYNLYV